MNAIRNIGVFWIALVMFPFLLTGQEITIDTSKFEEAFPENQYLFYLTRYEKVMNELELTSDQQEKTGVLLASVTAKHDQHKERIRSIRDNSDKEELAKLHETFYKEISPDLTVIKKTLSEMQLIRLRQIAFQYFYVMKTRNDPSKNYRRILLDKKINSDLRLSSMQQDAIKQAYVALESGLKKLESTDSKEYKQMLLKTHASILGILGAKQGKMVTKIVGPPAQALNH